MPLWLMAILLSCTAGANLVSAEVRDRGVVLEELHRRFARDLEEPAKYRGKVLAECVDFPEGGLVPYTFPALGWTHMVFADPASLPERLPRIEGALRLAMDSAARQVESPGGDLRNLFSLQAQGAYLSQLGMALSAYRLAGGKDPRIVETETRIVSILEAALHERKGHPIPSYPDRICSIDTSIALMALHLHDRVEGSRRSEPLVARHLDWIEEYGTDRGTNLPSSRISTEGRLAPARGCDVSWRIALWQEMAPHQGREWYQTYRAQFWKKSTAASGFREWGTDQIQVRDRQSGPVIAGIGGNATLLGIAACRAVGDQPTSNLLMAQALRLHTARQSRDLMSRIMIRSMDGATRQSGISTSAGYLTGYLYGDATLFYSASWHPYPEKPIR